MKLLDVLEHPCPLDAESNMATDAYPSPFNAIRAGKLNDLDVLVGADDAGQIVVWSVADMKPIAVFLNGISSWSLAINNERGLVAVGANDFNISVFSTETRDVFKLEGHQHNIPSVDFSDCGDYLASCSVDGTLKVWDLETRQCLFTQSVSMVSSHNDSDRWCWSVRLCEMSNFMLSKRVHEEIMAYEPEIMTTSMDESDGGFHSRFRVTEDDMISVSSGSSFNEMDRIEELMLQYAQQEMAISSTEETEDDAEEDQEQDIQDTRSPPQYVTPPSYDEHVSKEASDESFYSAHSLNSFQLEHTIDQPLFIFCSTRKELHLFHVDRDVDRLCFISDLQNERQLQDSSSLRVPHPLYENHERPEGASMNIRMRQLLQQSGRLAFVNLLRDELGLFVGAVVYANQNGDAYILGVNKYEGMEYSLKVLAKIPVNPPQTHALVGLTCVYRHIPGRSFWRVFLLYDNWQVFLYDIRPANQVRISSLL